MGCLLSQKSIQYIRIHFPNYNPIIVFAISPVRMLRHPEEEKRWKLFFLQFHWTTAADSHSSLEWNKCSKCIRWLWPVSVHIQAGLLSFVSAEWLHSFLSQLLNKYKLNVRRKEINDIDEKLSIKKNFFFCAKILSHCFTLILFHAIEEKSKIEGNFSENEN